MKLSSAFASENRESGFSLVELMIVVGIIGILSTLAMPKFRQFQAKAKMSEAKNTLTHLYTLQQAYQLDSNTFINVPLYGRLANGNLSCVVPANALTIGFEINPCDGNNASPVPRYGYQVINSTRSVFDAQALTGAQQANLVCPGNDAHGFGIDENKQFIDTVVGNAAALTRC